MNRRKVGSDLGGFMAAGTLSLASASGRNGGGLSVESFNVANERKPVQGNRSRRLRIVTLRDRAVSGVWA